MWSSQYYHGKHVTPLRNHLSFLLTWQSLLFLCPSHVRGWNLVLPMKIPCINLNQVNKSCSKWKGSPWARPRPCFTDRKAQGQHEGPTWHHQQIRAKVVQQATCPSCQPRAGPSLWPSPSHWEVAGWDLCWSCVLLLIAVLQGMPSLFKRLSFVAYRRRLHRLGVSKVTQVDFLPREVVSYSKETQTPLATHQSEGKLCLLFAFPVISRRNCQSVISFLLLFYLTITDLPRT